jgi:23S rRNA (pseudouridine1915-N3)-methyltransferase
MASVTVISVGTLKEQYLKDAVKEYKKRLSQLAAVEEIELKEERIHSEDDEVEIKRALECEGERILAAVPKGASIIALCIEGKQYSSEELATLIGKSVDTTGKIAFVIGSSHGLSDKVKCAADQRLSFSRLTFPHQLVKPLLLEVIYRSFSILAGKRYHK